MVPPVACFAGGHRKIYKQDLRKLDIKFRKLVRTIVGPPGGSNWFVPWHDVLHEWNAGILDVKLYTLPSFLTNRLFENKTCPGLDDGNGAQQQW